MEKAKSEFSSGKDLELLSGLRSLDYPMALLSERRPGFDDLPYQEQLALLEGICDRVFEFLEALRKLVSFLEFGAFDPAKGKAALPNRTVQNADRYIKAAVLRDVEGLTHPAIAEEMNVPLPRNYEHKKDIEAVRDLYEKGRTILERALGEGGWSEQTEAMKAEIEWWNSLSPEEKEEDRSYRSVVPATEEIARGWSAFYDEWVESTYRGTPEA